MKSFFLEPNMIGLDIQPNKICLIGLRKIKHQFYLEHRGIQKIDADTVFVNGKIKHWDTLTILLADLVKSMKINSKLVSLHLPFHLVKTQRIQLPFGLSDTQIISEINLQVRNDWPNMDSYAVDYFSLTEDCSEIIYVVSSHEYLSQYIECVRSAGLHVKAVDVDAYALMRAINYVLNIFSGENSNSNSLSYRAHADADVILYITDLKVTMFLVNRFEVIAYQYWDVSYSEVDWIQLGDDILVFLAAFSSTPLKELIVCGNHQCFSSIIDRIANQYALSACFPDIFAHIKSLSQGINNLDKNYWLACSLAMRENYKW